MCFSPQADLVGGVVISGIGIDACRHVGGRRNLLLLAALPLLLGAHQFIEAFVWWGAEGDMPHAILRLALWTYLLIAFVVLPIFVPLAVTLLEPTKRRRWQMAPFLALGCVISSILLEAMVRGPIAVRVRPWHLAYTIHLSYGAVVVGLYVVAICGSLLFSGYRHVVIFGLVNLVAVIILARLTIDGFASMWCGYAALTAAAITIHMRLRAPHRDIGLATV
jgi:hypothetical protein